MSSAVFRSDAFVYEKKRWDKALRDEYLLEGQAALDTIKNAVALPLREIEGSKLKYGDGLFAGGVSDSEFNFIAGLRRSAGKSDVNRNCTSSYEVADDDLEFRDESVIFGGVLMRHFGHMLCDGTTRLWYPATHPEDRRKVVFVMYPREKEPYFDILELAGISRDRVEIILKPTRFAEMTIPGETVHSLGECGYKEEWRGLLSRMRQNVEPSPYKKIYYTRTKFEGSGCVGEEYFEDFYSSNGFMVVSPETLPFREQVALMAGADEVVTTMGTTAIQSIFTKPGTRFTVLNRSKTVVKSVILSLHVAQSRATFVDVYKSFLPEQQAGRCVYLLAPTKHWEAYLKKEKKLKNQVAEYPLEENIYHYILEWGERYKSANGFQWIKNETVPGIAARINSYFFDREIAVSKYPHPSSWQKLEDENENLYAEVMNLKERLILAKASAQTLCVSRISPSENGIIFCTVLNNLGAKAEDISVIFRLRDVIEKERMFELPVEFMEGEKQNLLLYINIDSEKFSQFCVDGAVSAFEGFLEVKTKLFASSMPLFPSLGHVEEFVLDGNLVGFSGSSDIENRTLFQIGKLSDWFSAPGESRITKFEWNNNKAIIRGSFTHPLAGNQEGSLHLASKKDCESFVFIEPQSVSRETGSLDWVFSFDPTKIFEGSTLEECIFDLDFEIRGIHKRINFGRKRPKGTMALMRAVDHELGNNKLVAVEDEDKSIGFVLHPLVTESAPKINSIKWVDSSLEIEGEFAHPILLENPNVQFFICVVGPKDWNSKVACSISYVSKGVISWCAIVSPLNFYYLNQVDGKYRLFYIVDKALDVDSSKGLIPKEKNSLQENFKILKFPFGLRRPKGTLSKFKAGKFTNEGISCCPVRFDDKSLGFLINKESEKACKPEKPGKKIKLEQIKAFIKRRLNH